MDGKVYKLLNAMYELRDAGAAFDRKVTEQFQHLCWIPESDGHVGQAAALA